MDLSHQNLKKIEELYENISTNLVEQQSETSKQWERIFRGAGRLSDKIATPVAGGIRTVADYGGQAASGAVRAMTGGAVDLEKIGKKAEKIIGTGGGKPQQQPTKSKPQLQTPTPKPQQRDSGRAAGEYLAPSRGSSRAADPLVRAGGSYGFFGPIKPAPTKSKPSNQQQPVIKPPSNSGVKRDPRGAVIVNHLEIEDGSLVTEAPAQVAPISGTGGRGWYQKNKQGKYVPITDPELAKQAAARWKAEQQKQKQQKAEPPKTDPKPEPPKPAPKPEATKPAATKPAPKPAPGTIKPSDQVSKYMSAAAAARQSKDPAQMAKVRDMGMEIWKAKYKDTLAKKVSPTGQQLGTGQSVMAKQADQLRALRPTTPQSQTSTAEPQAQSRLSGGSSYSPAATKLMSQRTKNVLGVKEQYDAFDLVLEYLLSQGHVDTLDEALYVMMEMSAETVHHIVEGIIPDPINPDVHRRLQRIEKAAKLQKGTTGPESQAAGSAVKRLGGSGVTLPGV